MMAALPLLPRRSLRNPASKTEIPPKSGNRALFWAASATVSPTDCVKYVGVHRLNVSRRIVTPQESKHTSQKTRLRANVSNSERKLSGVCFSPSDWNRLAGLTRGSG